MDGGRRPPGQLLVDDGLHERGEMGLLRPPQARKARLRHQTGDNGIVVSARARAAVAYDTRWLGSSFESLTCSV